MVSLLNKTNRRVFYVFRFLSVACLGKAATCHFDISQPIRNGRFSSVWVKGQVRTSFVRARDGEQLPRVPSVHREPLAVRVVEHIALRVGAVLPEVAGGTVH
eukprot:COSAG06_NODE_25223_length_642_cov_0.607735_1_plen_101_part_01